MHLPMTVIIMGIFVVFFLGVGLNHVYALHILDSTTYYDDHPFLLKITNPISPPEVYVTIRSDEGIECTYTLTQIPSTTIWQSPYIYFTDGEICTTTTFPMGADKVGSITATSDDADPISEPATVTSGNELAWPVSAMDPQPQWSIKISNCASYGGDSPDNDGICNDWEIEDADPGDFVGLRVPYLDSGAPSGVFWELPCGLGTSDPVCPRDGVKDVYVEVDWMRGHRPSDTAIQNVKDAFTNMGYATLHVIVDDDDILHDDSITTPIAGGAGSTEFDSIKKAFFGTNEERDARNEGTGSYNHKLTSKKQVFHYALFIHSQTADPSLSGTAEKPGNDFVISLGDPAFLGSVGSGDQQEGTFMHELGHNLKLDHGGSDGINCKPNYLSVMSYSRQFRELYPVDRDLDYSRLAIGPRQSPSDPMPTTTITLDESSLDGVDDPGTADNPSGIDNYYTAEKIVYGVSTAAIFKTQYVNRNVDWDGDNAYEQNETPADINFLSDRTGCDTVSPGESLIGVKDWNNPPMVFATKGYTSWSDGVQAKGSVFQLPDLSTSKYKEIPWIKDWFAKFWYKKYGNRGNNLNYELPHEITGRMVTVIRSSNVLHLDYNIQNLSDSSFSNPNDQKPSLHKDLMEVDHLVKQNNLHDAINELLKIRDDVQSFITMAHDRDEMLSILDNLVRQFEIATDTYESAVESPPSMATVSFDSPNYHTGNIATITIEAAFSNLDNDTIDIILARVASESDQTGMLIQLKETGSNTGIFVIDNLLLDSDPSDAARHMPKLQVHSGDTITARYFGSKDTATIP